MHVKYVVYLSHDSAKVYIHVQFHQSPGPSNTFWPLGNNITITVRACVHESSHISPDVRTHAFGTPRRCKAFPSYYLIELWASRDLNYQLARRRRPRPVGARFKMRFPGCKGKAGIIQGGTNNKSIKCQQINVQLICF